MEEYKDIHDLAHKVRWLKANTYWSIGEIADRHGISRSEVKQIIKRKGIYKTKEAISGPRKNQ